MYPGSTVAAGSSLSPPDPSGRALLALNENFQQCILHDKYTLFL